MLKEFPFKVVATTLRKAKTATRNDWGAICFADGAFHEAELAKDLEIFDRVGGGDSFASGLIYGFLTGQPPQWAVECGAAHGALAMTTPGDTTMVTLKEVTQVMQGVGRADRALNERTMTKSSRSRQRILEIGIVPVVRASSAKHGDHGRGGCLRRRHSHRRNHHDCARRDRRDSQLASTMGTKSWSAQALCWTRKRRNAASMPARSSL